MRTLQVLTITAVLLAASASVVAQSEEDAESRPPIASVGCSVSDIEPGDPGPRTIDVEGAERQFAMHVPEAHDGVTPVPMWIQLHGCCGGSGSAQVLQLKNTADDHGFVVVGPQDDVGKWNRGTMDTELDLSLANPDIAFMDTLIDHLGTELCIDLARVYAAGFSNGGEAANVLACVLEDRIAAAGAASSGLLDLGGDCDLERPVPFLAIHGSADSSNPMEGGYKGQPIKDKYGAERPIPDRVAAMAVRNGCEPEPTAEVVSEGVERLTWPCPVDGEVGLIVIDGMGHTWPMSYMVNARGIDAGETLWAFFERQSMPE